MKKLWGVSRKYALPPPNPVTIHSVELLLDFTEGLKENWRGGDK